MPQLRLKPSCLIELIDNVRKGWMEVSWNMGTWNPKQPFVNGCFNWNDEPNLYMRNGCLTISIHFKLVGFAGASPEKSPGTYLLTSLTVIVGNQILGGFTWCLLCNYCPLLPTTTTTTTTTTTRSRRRRRRRTPHPSCHVYPIFWYVSTQPLGCICQGSPDRIQQLHWAYRSSPRSENMPWASACQRNYVTKHFRYLKWRNPCLCKLYGYGLCKGKLTPKIALTRFKGGTSILGTWRSCWTYKLPPFVSVWK